MSGRFLLVCLIAVASVACAPVIHTALQDATITAGAKTALLNDTAVDGTRVDVRTEAGVVHLSGVVGSAEDADRVLSLVRGVDGVREVQSSLVVGGSQGAAFPGPGREQGFAAATSDVHAP